VTDFACALYLGLRHAMGVLRPWAQLTTGAPAALRPVPRATTVARRLAALQGCERATLVPSTLHGAWDLGGLLDPGRDAVLLDAEAYPVLRAAAERAVARGVPVTTVAHHDPGDVLRRMPPGRRPVLLVDGLCPACGGPAPLAGLLRALRPHGGLIVVDDTQALGLLGTPGGHEPAYGRGGGGSLPFHRLTAAPDVVVLASAAKALGVPVAALSGPATVIAAWEARSATRVHSSPVSAADVAALEHALAVNAAHGEDLRARLATSVRRFRAGLRTCGMTADGGPYPVQGLPETRGAEAAAMHRRLRAHGIEAVAQALRGGRAGRVVFIITARHTPAELDAALRAIARAASAPEVAA
jgi:8-amino-7-oxononanoate synthase